MSAQFVGSYVPQLVDVLTASALSRQNAIILGSPGWGKTAISRSLARHLSDGAFSFTRIDPSTPPDAVRGAYNPAALLEGRLERVGRNKVLDLVLEDAPAVIGAWLISYSPSIQS